MGGPGSGKGTQCDLLCSEFGMCHLSAGELLRQEARTSSDIGQIIADIMAEGKIVPSEVTVELLRRAMAVQKGPYLIDGFPRSLSNLEIFEDRIGSCEFMLFLELSEDEMCRRLLSRAETSGRSDDNIETIRKRFQTYEVETMPVVELMERRGLLRRVDADGPPMTVFKSIVGLFENAIPHAGAA